MRNDLIALSDDDLAAMTNLGSVRRARREVTVDRIAVTLAESPAGDITAAWADGPKCTLPAAKTVADGRCTCPAVGTICRHILRTIIAYQETNKTAAAPAESAWNPGAITDADLTAALGAPALAAAKTALAGGVLAEIVRSRKPVVRFTGLGLAVRFLVPHDLRYATADLEGPDRSRLLAMAILVCRQLPADRAAGLVVTGDQKSDPAHAPLLASLGGWLDEILLLGAAGTPSAVLDRGRALEEPLRAAGLHALADLCMEVLLQIQRYHRQDALFAPEDVAETVGEMLIRAAVVLKPVADIPASLVRGFQPGRAGDRDTGRFIGLGCSVRLRRRAVVISTVLQDLDTGSLAVITREHADPDDGKAPTLDLLVAHQFNSGLSLRGLARGTLQSPSCRREPGGRIILGRGRHGLSPQGFLWERLKDPVFVEDFAELRARLQALPPPCLRTRSAAGDVHVLAVSAVTTCAYDPVAQSWRWTVADADGVTCDLSHPFASRAAGGFAALGKALESGEKQVFVSAEIRLRAGKLVGRPLAVVFANDHGRHAVMPWCDPHPAAKTPGQPNARRDADQDDDTDQDDDDDDAADADDERDERDVVDNADDADDADDDDGDDVKASPDLRIREEPPVLVATERLLQEAMVNGLDRGSTLWLREVDTAANIATASGHTLLANHLRNFHTRLHNRAQDLTWEPTAAITDLRDLLQWYRLGLDLW